ncbi:MAG TPA: prepilin-type N-terminal cleavage/methylation domain-containing protein [Bryobacteraceae bacterium]|nr:prepilin-type N-terminal cleavage/methylation domain-containing protein [Bryobacteraceae bacterium]
MPTLLAGNRSRARNHGVTLIEMLVVIVLISILAGITFPTVSSGLESLRLNTAVNDVVTILDTGLNRAERRQQTIEVTISKAERALALRSVDGSFAKRLDLPDGITIAEILPPQPNADPDAPRTFFLYPGGTVPSIGVALLNRRGTQRIVRVDPMTGVPQVEK